MKSAYGLKIPEPDYEFSLGWCPATPWWRSTSSLPGCRYVSVGGSERLAEARANLG